MTKILRMANKTKLFNDLVQDISKVAKAFAAAQMQAEAICIFTGDRELLECPDCGLLEDVSSDGHLMTYKKSDGTIEDTGLRFQEIDCMHFRCPTCKCIVELNDEESNRE
ncbi:MAG: hypothetical protein SRB1_02943 [Desulfobacteraceae bacterium Eth-SRB1]|nr:MAG: hypothetical protein SRB1_02943 [Desulfobacteraceae bacterium Eth-SRB1]